MNISTGKFESVEQLIISEALRIQAINFHSSMNLMLVVLNTGTVIRVRISRYPRLAKADMAQLEHYKLLSGGRRAHWPGLDEDLSLKGFLVELLREQLVGTWHGARTDLRTNG